MGLRTRLKAGLRVMADGWARDLCVLYGIEPGQGLSLSLRRPAEAPDEVEVEVEPPTPSGGPRTSRPA